MPLKVGDKVTCNGNPEAYIIFIHTRDGVPVMADVRLWHGFRHVGDVTVSIEGLMLENRNPR